MATARFMHGPVARNSATAIGSTTSAVRSPTPSARTPVSIAGSEASEDCVEIATAWAGIEARILDGSQNRTPAEMRKLGLDLAAESHRPDGIICDSEMRTIALVGGLQESGLRLGEDIHLIYKQTSGILPTLFPALDSIREDVFAAGGERTRLLLKRIEGADIESLQTMAEPQPHWRS